MSDRLELHNTIMEYVIEFLGDVPEASAAQLRALDAALRRWKRKTDLDTLEITLLAPNRNIGLHWGATYRDVEQSGCMGDRRTVPGGSTGRSR